MTKSIQFVATSDKTLKVGQRLYLDGYLADVPEPAGWNDWPSGEFERWVAHREPVKLLLWADRQITFEGAGMCVKRGALIGEIGNPQLREDVYRWHLLNMEFWRRREEAYREKHPNEYRGIMWNCNHVTDWGNSIHFLRTFAARVNWLNVYDPNFQKVGINVQVLTRDDARRFVRIAETKRFISNNWIAIALVVFFVLVALLGVLRDGGSG